MSTPENIFVEIGFMQKKKHGQVVCGDTFLFKKIVAENRYVMVLSDGLGSGVKANVLSSITASMSLHFGMRREPIARTAQTIMNTLPADSVRKISYSTFSIIDIDADGDVQIAEYDNPPCLYLSGGKYMPLQRKELHIDAEVQSKTGSSIYITEMNLKKEDRLIFFTDGVSQSGLGISNKISGWEEKEIIAFVEKIVADNSTLSARDLARRIVAKAEYNDAHKTKDDTSCVVIYIREPRRLLVSSGPPFNESKDTYLSNFIKDYNGKKMICGGTTAQIVSRELGIAIETTTKAKSVSADLPPASKMQGIDLVTEGIITLGAVRTLLKNYNSEDDLHGNDPAQDIVRLFLESDKIEFMVGTKINEAHQDPSLPVELEIRRNVVKSIKKSLEEKFLKEVTMQYI